MVRFMSNLKVVPVMDGLEACKVIRSLDRPDASTIPIIALTANAFFEDTKNVLTQACFVACTFFYARYFPRSSFTSCNVIAASSRSMAVCTRVSLSSNTLWIFFPTGHCGFGFS